jgi:hypothetical protein
MDWSFIDWIAIASSGLLGAVAAGMTYGITAIVNDRGSVVASTIAAVIIVGSAKFFGLSAAPFIRAEMHDFDNDLKNMPVVSKIIDRHPDLRLRLTHILKTEIREIVDHETARVAAQQVLAEYLPRYFAQTSDIAISAYQDTWTTMLTQIQIVDSAACQAFLHGNGPLPVQALPKDFMQSVAFMTEQVIHHAIQTPHEEPSKQWVAETLETLMGSRMNVDTLFSTMPDFSCMDYLSLLDVASKQLDSDTYMQLLRGMIAAAYHKKIAES